MDEGMSAYMRASKCACVQACVQAVDGIIPCCELN